MRLRSTHHARRTTPDACDTILPESGDSPLERADARYSPRFPVMSRVSAALAVLAVLFFVVGCGTACRCCRRTAVAPASAPERVEIGGREYMLEANAWRDFQPVAPPGGQPLVVVVKVSPSDMMPLPSDIAIDRVWVLNGKEQWSAKPEPGATSLETAVRNGPKWGPGIKVDVVARLKQGEKTWLVRAAGVEVKRTD
jgi:hypothetical protein